MTATLDSFFTEIERDLTTMNTFMALIHEDQENVLLAMQNFIAQVPEMGPKSALELALKLGRWMAKNIKKEN